MRPEQLQESVRVVRRTLIFLADDGWRDRGRWLAGGG
jgi:hypothetical protein